MKQPLLDHLHLFAPALRTCCSELVVSSAPLHALGWFDPVFPPLWTIHSAAQSHRWVLRHPWKSGALTSILAYFQPFDTSAELIRFQETPQPSRLPQFYIGRHVPLRRMFHLSRCDLISDCKVKTSSDNMQLAASDEFQSQISPNEYIGKLDV